MTEKRSTVRIAAVADLHCGRGQTGSFQGLFAGLVDRADVLRLCGDLTGDGTADEARALARDINAVLKIPVLSVLGNHDFESGRAGEVSDILRESGVKVLDGDAVEVQGIGFAGCKGFA